MMQMSNPGQIGCTGMNLDLLSELRISRNIGKRPPNGERFWISQSIAQYIKEGLPWINWWTR